MGARGWFVFLYKGVYYRFFHHFDSYFQELGRELITILVRGGPDLLTDLRKFFSLTVVVEECMEPADEKFRSEWAKAASSSLKQFPLEDSSAGIGVQNHCENFLTGDGIFIAYIYLIDLDTNRFYASHDICSDTIFVYDINNALHPVFLDWAQEGNLPQGATWCQMFPVPKVHLDQVHDGMKEKGYDLVQDTPVSLGMHAFIFEARRHQDDPQQTVFVKVLRVLPKEGGEYKRPMTVADMLAKGDSHKNIVEILEKDRIGGFPTLILRGYDGTLDEVVAKASCEPSKKAVLFSRALGDAIHGIVFLMEQGIVHNDIKPQNILANVTGENGEEEVHAISWEAQRDGLLKWGDFGETKRDGKWLKGWDPYKKTLMYCHPRRMQMNP